MSDLAFQRFMASYMLTYEEQLPQNRQEIIEYTEDVLQAKGIECDKRISELSEEQIKEILEEVRHLRNKKKNKRRQQEAQQESWFCFRSTGRNFYSPVTTKYIFYITFLSIILSLTSIHKVLYLLKIVLSSQLDSHRVLIAPFKSCFIFDLGLKYNLRTLALF